jgi:uncharacterized protein YdhG (YjbR/CyaY superfamily)
MKSENVPLKNVDEFIATYPKDVQLIIKKIRTTIKKAAPKAEEIISYRMPAYKFHGRLLYFSAFKKHIGLYPMVSGIANFKKELSIYKGAKGSVQFPLNKPIPYDLITKIVKFRVKENIEKEKVKSMAKKK